MAESYPEDLLYHPEHDWARIDGDEAVMGITWHAQDALGELVHYEAPDVGSTVAKDTSYGEVESVKAVSDLISPLSGEVLEINEKVVDAPGDRQRGSVRRRLARPDPPLESLPNANICCPSPTTRRSSTSSELPLAHGRRPRGDARRDRCRHRRGAVPRHPGRRAVRRRARRAARAHGSRSCSGTSRTSPAGTSSTRSAFSAPASTTTTSRPSSTRSFSAASC